MEFTKEQLKSFREDPLMNWFANLIGTSMDDLLKDVEKENESHLNKVTPENKCKINNCKEDKEEINSKIKKFLETLDKNSEDNTVNENKYPHYSIKNDENYSEPGNPDTLVEDDGRSFSMSKEELEEFIKDYLKVDGTVRKLEHTYGIDLNANGDSIYSQYNNIIWNLIEKIFGEDNRDDIADFIYGDSNFDTVEDLYEELV